MRRLLNPLARYPVIPLARLPVSRFTRSNGSTGQPANGVTGQPANRPTGKRANRNGQTMLEMAIVGVGIVMFVYVFSRVWTWMNGTMVQRQEAFQHGRLAAGQRATAGQPVGYARPPLQLIGNPDSVGGDPPPGGIGVVLPPAPCGAAEPFYTRATALFAESQALQDAANAKTAETVRLGNKLAELSKQIRVVCSCCGRRCRSTCCSVVGPFAEIAQTKAELARTVAEGQDLMDQALAKADQANEQLRLGSEACP